MDSGIYKIEWVNSGHFYYGQSCKLKNRMRQHVNRMKAGNHENSRLQKVYNKYGLPVIVIVCFCEVDNLSNIEQYYLDKFISNPLCCNINPDSRTCRGRVLSQATKQKLSKSHSGKIISMQHRINISNGLKNAYKNGRVSYMANRFGDKNLFYGKKHTDETIKKLKGRVYECMIGGNNHKAIIVLNTQTGIFYDTIKEAAFSINKKPVFLYKKMKSKNNNTNFIQA